MKNLHILEYIWLDGSEPLSQLRSQTKISNLPKNPNITDFPETHFDGSSTNQSNIENSDCILKPVNFIKNPLISEGNGYLILCEVLDSNHKYHISNNRYKLRKFLDEYSKKLDPWVGFEQEYVIIKDKRPVGWPSTGFPEPQGPYYCGVGKDNTAGQEIAHLHMKYCLESGIIYHGMNSEVMLGQWEFQIGYRGREGERVDPLNICDHLWFARWLLFKAGECFDSHISFKSKYIKSSDWNGSGLHTNFSTKQTRSKEGFTEFKDLILKSLLATHKEDLKYFGCDLADRLTGKNETSNIDNFSYENPSNRNSSVRIPPSTLKNKSGYLEDRRPGADADPYSVCLAIFSSISKNL
ncbi:MAG: glutamine synthetase beta-grasp domain-containing protein [Rickettsia sp.]|nr:glutamine synthetase beta-grasp domain-containing protein [Rickettsia sp.]